MPHITVDISTKLSEHLAERSGQGEHLQATAVRALREWCDQGDGTTEQGGALALLIDELGASARGELPPPTKQTLNDWFGMLRTAVGWRNEQN